jgi:glutamyl-tRNA synthetase
VVLRSNGQPVYNFCVAVDDATMHISHVIRAEEHLPNTLRQALIYNALGFPMPQFGHVSLILAPDRSKLSKRHGATSVGQFREMGFLAPAMVNYLALLGWNDGTEDEIFTVDQIIQKFSIDRVTKSGAIFDQTKLQWVSSDSYP